MGGIRQGRHDRPGAFVLVDEGAFGREKGAPRRQLEPRSNERVTSGKEPPGYAYPPHDLAPHMGRPFAYG